MTFNQYLIKLLQNIAIKTLKKNNNKLNVAVKNSNIDKYNTKESSDVFYKTTINSLDYKSSKTFFTSHFQEELKEILCSYSDFKKMSSTEKKNIQEQLWNLSLKEFEWKTYNKKLIRETSSNIPFYFDKQFDTFKKICEIYMYPKKEQLNTQRAYRNYFSFKAELFLRFIFKKIIETNNFDSILHVLKLTSDDYEQIIKNYVFISYIFNDILKISIKLAHDNLFNKKKNTHLEEYYNDNALVVFSNDLRHSFQFTLAMNLINATLNYCKEKKLIDIDILELSIPIQTYLMTCKPSYATHGHSEWGIHCDNAAIILNIFESCNIFTDVIIEKKYNTLKNKPYLQKKLILPKSLESDIFTKPLKFPNIIKPKTIKLSDVNDLIKPIVSGERHVVISKELINCLNYSCSKKFKISESFYLIVKLFFDMTSNDTLYNCLSTQPLDIGFPTILDINKQQSVFDKLNTHKTRGWTLYLANFYKNQILGNTAIKIDNFSSLFKLSGNTEIELVHYLFKEQEFLRLNSMIMESKMAYTSVEMAKWLLNYPIYITDKMCIRLRLYPVEHWISRTSGVLKHLLCDYKSIKLTLKGLISLMQAYYACDQYRCTLFNIYITKNNISDKKLLFDFFHNNYLDFTKIKNTLYFLYLHVELLKTEKVNKTDVNIEIDQTASGIVFLSLLLRDKKMAKAANLISPEKSCPYIFVMSHFEEFAYNNMTNLSKTAIDFLKNNRKLHKYALMCYTYNQTHIGRIEDFKNSWIQEYNRYPTYEENKTLNEFATKYDDFIELIFPNTQKKLTLLNKAVELIATVSERTTIATLEGEYISWSFYKSKNSVRHKFNPSTMKSYSYKLNAITSDKKLDIQAHKKKFLSYLIHSIDAAVLRIIIRNFAEKMNYNINHLHDCIILHPNYVEDFYNMINELYHSDDMYYLAERLVFQPMKSSISIKSDELDKIKQEYLSLCDDFKNEMKFDPKNIYRFED